MEHDKYAVYIVFLIAIIGIIALAAIVIGGTGSQDLAGEAFARMSSGRQSYTTPIQIDIEATMPDIGLADPDFTELVVGIQDAIVQEDMLGSQDITNLGSLVEQIKQGFLEKRDPKPDGSCDYEDEGCSCFKYFGSCYCVCDDDDDVDISGIIINEDIIENLNTYVIVNFDIMNIDELKNLVVVQSVLLDIISQNMETDVTIP